jgi:ribosomal protein S18 acetylase RimI-like enzyme
MIIRRATIKDLEQLSLLFAQYRVFYEQSFEPAPCREFLEERLNKEESVVFVALDEDAYAAFTQLYPSFSSVGMKKIWILNDLFVSAEHRQKGIARSLISHVIDYAKTTGRTKVVLSTAYSNINAQKLYEKMGFFKEDFFNYERVI